MARRDDFKGKIQAIGSIDSIYNREDSSPTTQLPTDPVVQSAPATAPEVSTPEDRDGFFQRAGDWLKKIPETTRKFTQGVDDFIDAAIVPYFEGEEEQNEFFKQNSKTFDKFVGYSFNPFTMRTKGNVSNDDLTKLQDAKTYYDQRNQIKEDPTLTNTDKVELSKMYGEKFDEAISGLKVKPNEEETRELMKKMGEYNERMNIIKGEKITKAQQINEDTSKLFNTINENIDREKFLKESQGKDFGGKKVSIMDIERTVATIIEDKNIKHVYETPLKLKQAAEEEMKENPVGSDKYNAATKALSIANKLIEHNEKELVPFLTYIAQNIGNKGETITEITKNYEKETGKGVTDIFSTSYGDDTPNKFKKILSSNVGDEAQMQLSILKTRTADTMFMQGLEGLGIIQSGLGRAADKGLGIFRYPLTGGSPFNSMDMVSFENLTSYIARTNNTRTNTIKNFFRNGLQAAPEIIEMIYGIGKITKTANTIEALINSRKLGGFAKIAGDVVELINKGQRIDGLASSLSKVPMATRNALIMMDRGEDLVSAVKAVSKGDVFLQKQLISLVKNATTEYVISGLFQGYNPEKYSATDLVIDSIGGFLDISIDAMRIANKQALEPYKKGNAFFTEFSKRWFNISDTEREKYSKETKEKFLAQSQLTLIEYDEILNQANSNPALKGMINTIMETNKMYNDVLDPAAKAKKYRDRKPTYENMKASRHIPTEMDKETYDQILRNSRDSGGRVDYDKLDNEIEAYNKAFKGEMEFGTVPKTEGDKLSILTKDPVSVLTKNGYTGTTRVNGKKYNVVYLGDNAYGREGGIVTRPNVVVVSKGKAITQSFLLLEPGESVAYKKDGRLKGINTNDGFIDYNSDGRYDRIIKFYKNKDGKGNWGTLKGEKIGMPNAELKHSIKNETPITVDQYDITKQNPEKYYYGKTVAFDDIDEVKDVIKNKGTVTITNPKTGVKQTMGYAAIEIPTGKGKVIAYVKDKNGVLQPYTESVDNVRFWIHLDRGGGVITVYNNRPKGVGVKNDKKFRIGMGSKTAKWLGLIEDYNELLDELPKIEFNISDAADIPKSLPGIKYGAAFQQGIPDRVLTRHEIDNIIYRRANHMKKIGVEVDRDSIGKEIFDNPTILGAYFSRERLIKLPNPKTGTIEHELIHARIDKATSPANKAKLFNYAMATEDFAKRYPNKTLEDVEEYVADMFFEYLKNKPKTIPDKIRKIFRDITNRMFRKTNEMESFYKRVEEGVVDDVIEIGEDYVKRSGLLREKNILKIEPDKAVDRKAKIKAIYANKYIGYGDDIQGSSTQLYRKQAGENANVGEYNSSDTIFLSVGGMRGPANIRAKNLENTKKEIDKAIEAGATIIKDNEAYTQSSMYNTGEREMSKYLSSKGYLYKDYKSGDTTIGVWYNPVDDIKFQKDLVWLRPKELKNLKLLGTNYINLPIFNRGEYIGVQGKLTKTFTKDGKPHKYWILEYEKNKKYYSKKVMIGNDPYISKKTYVTDFDSKYYPKKTVAYAKYKDTGKLVDMLKEYAHEFTDSKTQYQFIKAIEKMGENINSLGKDINEILDFKTQKYKHGENIKEQIIIKTAEWLISKINKLGNESYKQLSKEFESFKKLINDIPADNLNLITSFEFDGGGGIRGEVEFLTNKKINTLEEYNPNIYSKKYIYQKLKEDGLVSDKGHFDFEYGKYIEGKMEKDSIIKNAIEKYKKENYEMLMSIWDDVKNPTYDVVKKVYETIYKIENKKSKTISKTKMTIDSPEIFGHEFMHIIDLFGDKSTRDRIDKLIDLFIDTDEGKQITKILKNVYDKKILRNEIFARVLGISINKKYGITNTSDSVGKIIEKLLSKKIYINNFGRDKNLNILDNIINFLNNIFKSIRERLSPVYTLQEKLSKDIIPELFNAGVDLNKSYDSVFEFNKIPEKPSRDYKGVQLEEVDNNIRPGVSARYNRKLNKIFMNPELLTKLYEDKAWTKARTNGVNPLPEDTFKSYDEREKFILEHEYSHSVNPQQVGEAKHMYEDRINEIALRSIGKQYYLPKDGLDKVKGVILGSKEKINVAELYNNIALEKKHTPTKWIVGKTDKIYGDALTGNKYPVNVSDYDVYDTVMVYSKGDLDWRHIDNAINGGATIVAKDNKIVQSYLESKGYSQDGSSGVWKVAYTPDGYDREVIEKSRLLAEDTEKLFVNKDFNINTVQDGRLIMAKTIRDKIKGMDINKERILLKEFERNNVPKGSTLGDELERIRNNIIESGGDIKEIRQSDQWKNVESYMKRVNLEFFGGQLNIEKAFGRIPESSIPDLVNMLRSGNQMEYLKFLDPGKYKGVRDDIATAQTFWGIIFENKTAFGKYQRVVSAFANDDHFQRMLGAWYKAYKFLGAGHFYKIGQQVLNIGGLSKLLLINTLGLPVEDLAKYKIINYTPTDLYDFRKKYGILFDDDADKSLRETFKHESFIDVLKNIQKKVEELYNAGFYNAGDILSSTGIKNDSLGQAIEEIYPRIKGRGELDSYLKGLTEQQRIDELGNLYRRSEEIYNKRTGMLQNYKDADVVFDSRPKQAVWWAYNFMGSWSLGVTKAALRTVRDQQLGGLIKGSYGKKYLEKLTSEGKQAADDWILRFYQNNGDMLTLMDKIFFAIYLGARVDRTISDNGDPVDKIRGMYEMGSAFSFPIQALTSNPFGRAVLSFIDGLGANVGEEGFDEDNLKAGGIKLFEQLMKDITRRFVLPKAILSAANTDNENMYIENLINSWTKATGGYLYYSAQDVTKNNFLTYTPKTNKAWLSEILPISDEYIDKFRKLTTDKRLDLLINDFDNNKTSRWMYQVPFIKDYHMGAFSEEDYIIELIELLGQDQVYYNQFLKGELDISKHLSVKGGAYVYNLLEQMNPRRANKPEKWFDDLRKRFDRVDDKDGELNVNYAAQNKEDAFVYEMRLAMGEGRYADFVNLFEQAGPKGKAGLQLMAFAEANSPGAGKELLAAIVGTIATKEYTKAGNWKMGTDDPAQAEIIKAKIGAEYGNLLYIVDKQARTNVGLYYIKENYPQYSKYISDTGEKNMSQITFHYGSDESSSNKLLTQMYMSDTIAKMSMAAGDYNGYKLSNAFSTIWMPRRKDVKSENYYKAMLGGVNNIIDYIKKSDLSDQDQTKLVSGILVSGLNNISKIIKDPEIREKILPEIKQTMPFLFGTLEDINNIGKEVGMKDWMKDKYGVTTKTSIDDYYSGNGYRSSYLTRLYAQEYGASKQLYDQIRNMANIFKSYNTGNYGRKTYGNKYYTEGERDYMISLGTRYDRLGKGKVTGFSRKQSFKSDEKTGRSPEQASGYARPKAAKIEDPDKPVNFDTRTFKRTISRKSIKSNRGKSGKSGSGRGLYNASYSGGNTKRRVSRSKGRNTKRSN